MPQYPWMGGSLTEMMVRAGLARTIGSTVADLKDHTHQCRRSAHQCCDQKELVLHLIILTMRRNLCRYIAPQVWRAKSYALLGVALT